MTPEERERLTRVEEKLTLLDEVRADVKIIRSTLDEIRGGRKVVMMIAAALGAIAAGFANWLQQHLKWH